MGCDNVISYSVAACMHACIKWVCSFKTLHRTLVRVYVKVRNGVINQLHVCWFESLEFLEYPLFVCVCVCLCVCVCMCVYVCVRM